MNSIDRANFLREYPQPWKNGNFNFVESVNERVVPNTQLIEYVESLQDALRDEVRRVDFLEDALEDAQAVLATYERKAR